MEKSFGRFKVGAAEVHGQLTLDGEKTRIYLESDEHNLPYDEKHSELFGVINRRQKVSVLGILWTSTLGSADGVDGEYHFAEGFPHRVVLGGASWGKRP